MKLNRAIHGGEFLMKNGRAVIGVGLSLNLLAWFSYVFMSKRAVLTEKAQESVF
jgi:hypothetical protein